VVNIITMYYWYPLKVHEVYIPVLCAFKYGLDPEYICLTKNQCNTLCKKLNKEEVKNV
jgi:hypothetical protein